MSSQNPTSTSGLNSGSLPPSYGSLPPPYGAFRSNNGGFPRSSSFAAPGPTTSQCRPQPPKPPDYPQKQRFLAICLVTACFLVIPVLAVCRSRSLATYVDLKSRARRASEEASALVEQRARWEREKEDMRHDREVWEEMSKERPLPRSSWSSNRELRECYAYGKREYRGTLRNIPAGWSDMDACMNTPVQIKVNRNWPAIEIKHPSRCTIEGRFESVVGHWIVDWGQDDCKPALRYFNDTGCTNHRSGLTRIEAQVIGILNQDWRVMCETIPFTWGGINYTSPARCEERQSGANFAVWDVPDESCR